MPLAHSFIHSVFCFCFLAIGLSGCSSTFIGEAPKNIVVTSSADGDSPADFDRPNWMRDVPSCTRSLGTIALYESEMEMQGPFGPQNATPMLRYLLQRSGCFTVLDRSPALTKLEGEIKYDGPSGAPAAAVIPPNNNNPASEAIATSQPMPAFLRADYLLTARVIFQEVMSNDLSLSGSGSMGSVAGHATYSGGTNITVSQRRTEVNVVLFLTDMRSSVQIMTEQGSAAKIDQSTSSFGGFFGDSLNSKTTAAALFDAYARLVRRLHDTPLIKDRKKK